jgi:hypothetical protein
VCGSVGCGGSHGLSDKLTEMNPGPSWQDGSSPSASRRSSPTIHQRYTSETGMKCSPFKTGLQHCLPHFALKRRPVSRMASARPLLNVEALSGILEVLGTKDYKVEVLRATAH